MRSNVPKRARARLTPSGLAGLLFLGGCLSASPFHTEALNTPEFRPEAFFMGTTHGEGTLVQRFKHDRKLSVQGHGEMLADGRFRLDQQVSYANGDTEQRSWYLRRTGPHSYTGTLSDASGNITAETEGNLLHIHYLLRQPAVYMDQRLYLQPDGRTVLNVATVSVLGIPWARLSETITRASPVAAAFR